MPAKGQRVGRGGRRRTMVDRRTNRQLTTARRLRRDMTVVETMLWRSLRNRGFGWKFRRQVPIGPYVADFACLAAKLIVELDGPPHETEEQRLHEPSARRLASRARLARYAVSQRLDCR